MTNKHLIAFLVGVGLATLVLVGAGAAAPQDEGGAPSMPDMAKMMEKAKKYTAPGEHHELLERFVGEWTIESRLFMGDRPTPPEKGRATIGWLMEGRWLRIESSGTMMRRPVKTFTILGYDNFKMSYVSTSVSSMDTAMARSEGDVDPRTGALLSYGTIDEYLTGEHDKMVKTVWRFVSKDEIVQEVHDLPIGEEHTKVVEITYKRIK